MLRLTQEAKLGSPKREMGPPDPARLPPAPKAPRTRQPSGTVMPCVVPFARIATPGGEAFGDD
jgi:hypothetical protein